MRGDTPMVTERDRAIIEELTTKTAEIFGPEFSESYRRLAVAIITAIVEGPVLPGQTEPQIP